MSEKTYKTGEVAKLAGISIRTLRYYDAIDLLKPSKVLENGHRQYNTTDIEKLQLILGLKLLDFSLEDIKTYLKKPDINLVDILTYQKQLLIQKINSYKSINSRIDFIVEHYKETDAERVTDIFSLYEMLQMVNHNEVLSKYLPEKIQEVFAGVDTHGTHAELDKALNLLAISSMKNIAAKDKKFIIETFVKFINDCFGEVTKETIKKTTMMLGEMSASDVNNKINIEEIDLYNWLFANLLD